jgi:hypothetical protein
VAEYNRENRKEKDLTRKPAQKHNRPTETSTESRSVRKKPQEEEPEEEEEEEEEEETELPEEEDFDKVQSEIQQSSALLNALQVPAAAPSSHSTQPPSQQQQQPTQIIINVPSPEWEKYASRNPYPQREQPTKRPKNDEIYAMRRPPIPGAFEPIRPPPNLHTDVGEFPVFPIRSPYASRPEGIVSIVSPQLKVASLKGAYDRLDPIQAFKQEEIEDEEQPPPPPPPVRAQRPEGIFTMGPYQPQPERTPLNVVSVRGTEPRVEPLQVNPIRTFTPEDYRQLRIETLLDPNLYYAQENVAARTLHLPGGIPMAAPPHGVPFSPYSIRNSDLYGFRNAESIMRSKWDPPGLSLFTPQEQQALRQEHQMQLFKNNMKPAVYMVLTPQEAAAAARAKERTERYKRITDDAIRGRGVPFRDPTRINALRIVSQEAKTDFDKLMQDDIDKTIERAGELPPPRPRSNQ